MVWTQRFRQEAKAEEKAEETAEAKTEEPKSPKKEAEGVKEEPKALPAACLRGVAKSDRSQLLAKKLAYEMWWRMKCGGPVSAIDKFVKLRQNKLSNSEKTIAFCL